MNADFVTTLRRWRRRWVSTTAMFVLSALSVALLVALAAVTDGVLIREPFPGADDMVVFTRPDQSRLARQRAFPLVETSQAAAESGVPVTAYGSSAAMGPEVDAPILTMVAANFFEFMQLRPQVGRLLQPADEQATRLAVISDGMWRRRFGRDTSVVGRGLQFRGATYTIVGVAPAGFDFPRGSGVWTVIDPQAPVAQLFSFLGRRPPSISQAQLEARAKLWKPTPLRDDLHPTDGRQLFVLAGVSGLLLLVVWIHLALTQLADASSRLSEFRVRLAIGASHWQLLRSGLADAYVVVTACVVAGSLLAPAVLTMLVNRLPSQLLTGRPLVIDGRSALLLLVALVIGLVAVTLATLPTLRAAFRAGVSATSADRTTAGSTRPIRWIAGMQFFSTTAVLYLLGLATSSIAALVATDVGYHPENVLAIQTPIGSPSGAVESWTEDARQRWIARLQDTLNEIGQLPGVVAVGTTGDHPGRSPGLFGRVWLPEAGMDRAVRSEQNAVTGHYFEALQIPIVAGRVFDREVYRKWPKRGWDEMVIDTTLASALGLDASDIGRELSIGGFPTKVVGIVGAIRPRNQEQAPAPRYYLKVSAANPMAYVLLVRFAGTREAARASVSTVLQHRYGTTAPLYSVFLTDELERLRAPYRGRFQILSFAGWMTAGLTMAGVFGGCAYTVARRRRELAVRMAMGATRGQILWTCIRGLLVASAVGTGAGLLVGVFLGAQLSSALYLTAPSDPRVLGVISVVALCIAGAGAVLPVRRVWNTDVTAVLRQD